MIINDKIILKDFDTTVQLSSFLAEGGVREWHVLFHIAPDGDSFLGQKERLMRSWEAVMQMQELRDAKPVFKRYFLSDIANQAALIDDADACTKSLIQQPPLDGSKIALWAYLIAGAEVEYNADSLGSTVVNIDGQRHVWTMGMAAPLSNSHKETALLLDDYETALRDCHRSNIADNCIRTWFFVRDVDTNYKGLVVARRENFLQNGLTPETHYIASTGIGGSPADTKALVQLDAYAVTDVREGQQQYLYALSHLNKTIEYGVTFERGTLLKLSDRRHAYISGTASIDNKGQVMHVGDIVKQTHRMWENVEQLLKEAQMSFDDVMQIIVYLRDIADYDVVRKLFCERFPKTPHVITLAPVCRPQWLIEMECIAVNS